MQDKPRPRANLLLCLVLVVVTLAVYWQVHGFDFIDMDDPIYVKSNPHVLAGLSGGAIGWAFTTNCGANWHPLTWLSLMLDAQLGGGTPGIFHVTNVIFHILNTLLLFAVLRMMTGPSTGSGWRSAAVAILFALHPLHAESVAWVSERKDVLSTFLWLLTMLAYVRYARRPSFARYMPVLIVFALGLMAKPMLVSLPIVLLLIDYWPLGGSGKSQITNLKSQMVKLPLFALSGVVCVVTCWAQSATGAMAGTDAVPLGIRVANAIVSYVAYVGKTLCPLNLSPCYAHPLASLPTWQVIGSGLLLVLATAVVIKSRAKRPYLLVGWLWYVVTLVPVIGLVQVGQQSMADRYMYVPSIGLFIIAAWGVPEILAALRRVGGDTSRISALMPGLGLVLLVGLSASTYYQVGYWRNGVGLFEHAVEVNPDSYLAHSGLGFAYAIAGRYPDSLGQYAVALKLRPGLVTTHYGLGLTLMKMRKLPQAVAEFRYVVKAMPGSHEAATNLGGALLMMGRVDESIAVLRQVVKAAPGMAGAHSNLGCAYMDKGDTEAAVRELRKALEIDPRNADALRNLAELSSAKARREAGPPESGR